GRVQDGRRDHALRQGAQGEIGAHQPKPTARNPRAVVVNMTILGRPLELWFEAVMFGILLGCFYAAVSIGLSVSFGLLDVPNVAHPAVMIVGSYATYVLASYGIDPIVAGVLLMPLFFVFGILIYRFYYESFE